MSKAPHIQFSWPLQSLSAMLQTIGISGLGPLDAEKPVLSHWPQREHWADYIARLAAANHHLLTAQEQEEIDTVLTRAEGQFNQLLTSLSVSDSGSAAAAGRVLHELLDNAQEQICRHRTHAHAIYPFFARWITLHLAAFAFHQGDDEHTAHLQGIGVWKAGREFLERACQSACGERMSQIGIAITGADDDKVYVRDNRLGMALTSEVSAHGEEQSHLHQVMAALRYEAANRYIRELSLEDGIVILEHAHDGVTVSADSPIKQDQLMAPRESWQTAQAALRADIDEALTGCGEWYERLVTEHARSLGRENSPRVRSRTKRRAVEGYDVFSAMTTGLVGMVPVVGSVLKPATGLLLRWLDGRPDPWVEFEEKMKGLIKANLDAENARYIRNSLNGFDYELDLLLKEHDASFQAGRLQSEATDFGRRIGAMSERLSVFTPHILNPRNFHATVPYFEHFFLLSVAINLTGEKINVSSYDFPARRNKLYEMTERYVEYAMLSAADERRSDIGFKNFDKGCNYRVGDSVYDYRRENALSDTVQGLPTNVKNNVRTAAQSAAGVVGAAQLLRMPTMNAILIVENDATAGFDVERLKDVYLRTMRKLHRQMKDDWGKLQDAQYYNHKRYLHTDVHVVTEGHVATYDDYTVVPSANILRLPSARPEEGTKFHNRYDA
ncbi:hypothetical protein [Trinickia soli]|nr:hypothetical protein [Trinickia soli]CAB3706292.1 hypothetical protein LMG24076_03721 [Trinickia soli]